MTTAEFLSSLRDCDIRLWAEHGRVRCSAPAGAVNAEIKAELARRKDEILAILRHADSLKNGPHAIVPLKPDGQRPPLFGFPGHNGDVFCYVHLAHHLDPSQPLLGVQPPGLDGSGPLHSIEELGTHLVQQIRQRQAQGPYFLAGYCAGGTVAFEVARQLCELGQRVALLALIGAPFPLVYRWAPWTAWWIKGLVARARLHLRVLASGSVADRLAYVRTKLRQRRKERAVPAGELHRKVLEGRQRVEHATLSGLRRYQLRSYPGEIDLFLPSEGWRSAGGRPDLWRTVASATREHVGPDGCPADEMLLEPYVSSVATKLRLRLDEIAAYEGGGASRMDPPR
jgi:thioesterase domain-containing protein